MFAKIAIDKAAFGFDKLFDYSVPEKFEEKINKVKEYFSKTNSNEEE